MMRSSSITHKYAIRFNNQSYYGGVENEEVDELENAQAFDTFSECQTYIDSNLNNSAMAVKVLITRAINEFYQDIGAETPEREGTPLHPDSPCL